jgi:TonB family protein
MVTTTSSNTLSLQTNKIIREINWSLLASISVHGFFFTLIFPQWNHQNNNADTNKSRTNVVELNSIEQTRLPNLTPRNSFNWDTLNTLPPSNTSFPLPSAINIPIPPVSNGEIFLPNFDSGTMANLPAPPSLPAAANFSPINEYYNPNIPSPPADYLPTPPPLNQNAIATLPPDINYDTPSTNFNTPNNNFETPTTGKVIDINQDPNQEAEIRQQLFQNREIEITANPRDVINGRIPQTFTQIDANGNITIIPPSEIRPNFTSISDKIQKQSENTSDEDARKNYVAWATQVKNITPQQLTISGIYPKEACVGKLEGTTTYGLTVNPSGNVINSQLIKSSGYPLLNDQALRQIRSRNFANDSGGEQPYHVYVNFNYNSEICPSLSISNIGETSTPNPSLPREINPPPVNNISPINTPSVTPKPETPENKPNNVSIPKPLPVIPQSSPEQKPVVQQEGSINSEVKLPESKPESQPNPVIETKPETVTESKPTPVIPKPTEVIEQETTAPEL